MRTRRKTVRFGEMGATVKNRVMGILDKTSHVHDTEKKWLDRKLGRPVGQDLLEAYALGMLAGAHHVSLMHRGDFDGELPLNLDHYRHEES